MTRLGNNLRGIRKMNEDDRKEGKPPQTPRQDRWQDDEFLTAGVRAAREDDRRRAQGRCCDCGGELPADLQGNPNPTSCHDCAAAYVGAAHREMDAVRSSVSYSESDSLQGCRESDRIAEGLDAMGKPTYGKNAIQHCYMCHAWCRGDIFIVTAVDINGKELCWKSTKDLAEVGSIVREFSGV